MFRKDKLILKSWLTFRGNKVLICRRRGSTNKSMKGKKRNQWNTESREALSLTWKWDLTWLKYFNYHGTLEAVISLPNSWWLDMGGSYYSLLLWNRSFKKILYSTLQYIMKCVFDTWGEIRLITWLQFTKTCTTIPLKRDMYSFQYFLV